jgi:hypothetical protein
MIPFVFLEYISHLILWMAFSLYICALIIAHAFVSLQMSIFDTYLEHYISCWLVIVSMPVPL